MKDFFEHIDEYMEDKLSSNDRAAFEAEMERDARLQSAVNNYHDAKGLSEGLLEMDIKETLHRLEQEANKSQDEVIRPNKGENKNRRWFFIFGLLGAMLLLTWWFTNGSETSLNKEELLANYVRPIDVEATRSIDTVGMNLFQKGKYFFALNRFEESEEWLKRSIANEKNPQTLSQVYYWLGAAHIEQGEVEEAKKAWGESDEEGAKESLRMIE